MRNLVVRKTGKSVPQVLLSGAKFSLAPADSEAYCYIKTAEGKYDLTRRESHLLSKMSKRYTARFRKFLAKQENPIRRIWRD